MNELQKGLLNTFCKESDKSFRLCRPRGKNRGCFLTPIKNVKTILSSQLYTTRQRVRLGLQTMVCQLLNWRITNSTKMKTILQLSLISHTISGNFQGLSQSHKCGNNTIVPNAVSLQNHGHHLCRSKCYEII